MPTQKLTQQYVKKWIKTIALYPKGGSPSEQFECLE